MTGEPIKLKLIKNICSTVKGLVFAVMVTTLLTAPCSTAFASDDPAEHSNKAANITVLVPTQPEQPQTEPAQKPVVPILYPVAVSESREHNRREIIRVYELSDDENPDHIPRESFEREGYYYELGEIVKGEMLSFDSREHVEPITVNTTSNDLETVLKLLAQTIEHHSEDGYIGVLTLDVSTIKIEQAGTRTNTSTARRTREYPHLSSNDLSLIPKSITDGGKTFNLENVDWKSASTEAINYTELPQTYTAVATYSAQVSSTSVTGYNTIAEYKGVISKTAQGKMRYTANYIGIPIVSPVLNKAAETPSHETESPETAECEENALAADEALDIKEEFDDLPVADMESQIETESESLEEKDHDDKEDKTSAANAVNGISPTLLIILLVIVAVIAYFAGKFGKHFISKMKKPIASILVSASLFSIPQAVYASDLSSLPSYGFGSANTENANHFDTSATNSGNTNANGNYHFDTISSQSSDNGSYANAYHMELGASGFHSSQFGYSDGQLIGKIIIEKLGRSINVYEGESLSSMNKGGGRFSFTGANTGNTAIIGHNRGRPNGYFVFVKDLREGDIVSLEMNGVTKRYAVSRLYTVSETDLSPLGQFGDSRLTLVTCVEGLRNQRRIAVFFEVGG